MRCCDMSVSAYVCDQVPWETLAAFGQCLRPGGAISLSAPASGSLVTTSHCFVSMSSLLHPR